jgi:hypothetical protein
VGFKTGYDPHRRLTGRPKGSKTSDIRTVLAKELAEQIHGDTVEIVQILIKHAKAEDQWAIKLYVNGILPYVLGKPKPDTDEEPDDDIMAQELANTLPGDVLGQIRELIVNSQDMKGQEAENG